MIVHLYALLLRLYPQAYRTEFGEEMQVVFSEMLRSRNGAGTMLVFLREIRDLPAALWQAHIRSMFAGGKLMFNQFISPSTRRQALIGALPFLAFGIVMMMDHLVKFRIPQSRYIDFSFYLLASIGLLIGWVRGFPLWSYGYLGWLLVFVWQDSWIPLGITILVALLWTRSLNPIKTFFTDIWNDWSRLILTSFSLIAWMSLIYDENHHPWLMLLMLGATLATSAGAWFFLRSGSLKGRILSVTGSFIAAVVLSSLAWSTGDWRTNYGWPEADLWYVSLGEAAPLLLAWYSILFWSVVIGAVHGVARKLQAR